MTPDPSLAGAIPAEPPIGGPLWSVVVPILLFVTACGATYLLYRHFAGRGSDDDESNRETRTGG